MTLGTPGDWKRSGARIWKGGLVTAESIGIMGTVTPKQVVVSAFSRVFSSL